MADSYLQRRKYKDNGLVLGILLMIKLKAIQNATNRVNLNSKVKDNGDES